MPVGYAMKTLSCGLLCVLAVCLLTTSLWGAKTPGKVVFSEESSLTIDGTWVTASGFIFRDGNPPSPINPLDFSASAIYLKGMDNRVDHCLFQGKRGDGNPSLFTKTF